MLYYKTITNAEEQKLNNE